jgi:hypothetical protein
MALVAVAYFLVQNETFGGSVLSVSDGKYLKNSPDAGNEDAFLINIVVNGGGESIQGEITPEMITQYGIKEIPGKFTLTVNLKNVTCSYPISAENEVVYKIYQATVRDSLCSSKCGSNSKCTDNSPCPFNKISLDSVKQACKDTWFKDSANVHNPEFCGRVFAPTGTNTVSPGAPLAGGNCDDIVNIQSATINPASGAEASEWCYAMPNEIMTGFDGNHWRVTHIGGLPIFEGYKISSTATPTFVAEITLTNSNGSKATTTLTEKQTVQFISDIGKAKFVGSLIGQEMCGNPSTDYKIVKDLQLGTYKEVRRENYDAYQADLRKLQNFDNNYYAVTGTDPGLGADVLWSLMSGLNNEERLMATQKLATKCKIVNNLYVCTPTKDLIYPQLQLTIKSSWLGVIIPQGMPSIKNIVAPNEILNGMPNYLKVTITNTGNEIDSFDVALNCDKPVSLGSVRTSINKGESNDVFLNFVGDTGNYVCSVDTYSVNAPNNKDSKKVLFTITARDTPKPQTCEKIPNQPCDKAIWQGYPVCTWSEAMCVEKPNYMWIFASLAAIALAALLFFFARRNSGKKRRKR